MLIIAQVNLRNSTKTYSEKLKSLFSLYAGIMLEELNQRKLEVVLVKNNFGTGYHREAENTNPEWYRNLWHSFSYWTINNNFKGNQGKNKKVRPSSTIARPLIVKALGRLVVNKDWQAKETAEISRSRNDYELRKIIFDKISNEDYCEEACRCAPPQIQVSESLPPGTEFTVEDHFKWSDDFLRSPSFLKPCFFLAKLPLKNIPQKSGLYFFFEGKELVYIGVSKHFRRRIIFHLSKPGQERYPKVYDSYSYILFPYEEAIVLEKDYIAYYRPKYNVVHKDQPTNQMCIYNEKFIF